GDRAVDVLCFLLVLVGTVTVIGYGLWVLFAWAGQALAGESSGAAGRFPRCPGCGARLSPWAGACPHCGLLRDDPAAAELRDLGAAARVTCLLVERGELDEETCARLLQCLDRRRDDLLRRA